MSKDALREHIKQLADKGFSYERIALETGIKPAELKKHYRTEIEGEIEVHRPNDKLRARVEAFASFGASQEFIAKKLGISKDTLRRHYRTELDFGMEEANMAVMSTLYKMAVGHPGNPEKGLPPQEPIYQVAIFWAKARCGMKEHSHHTHEHNGTINTEAAQEAKNFDFGHKTLEEKLRLRADLLEAQQRAKN